MSKTAHYDELASEFESKWDFGPEYRPWVVRRVVDTLQLTSTSSLLDVGGGTGNFTAAIAALAQAPLQQCTVLEPSAGMAGVAAKRGLPTVVKGAFEYAVGVEKESLPFTQSLFKEVVHHLDLAATFQALFDAAPSGHTALVITRPQKVDFPFFQLALQAFADSQPPLESIVAPIEAAGWAVETRTEAVPITLATETWFAMLRARFMSSMADISDAHIEAGIEELRSQHNGAETVSFHDNLLFIIARKA